MKKVLLFILLLAPMAVMAQKFGHVNRQDIIQAMPDYTKAKNEIDALQKQYEADLKSMQDELTKKSQDYEANEKTFPENIKQRRQQELQDMYQKIQQSYQDNQQALQKAQQEKLGAIQEKVMAAVKKLGESGQYVYIVDISTGAIPFVSTTLSTDITDQLKKEVGIAQ